MNAFNLHPLSSSKRCLVCGKPFESYQKYDFLCSDACKELYFNQGGLPSQDLPVLRTTLQTSTGLLTLYTLGMMTTSPLTNPSFSTFASKNTIEAMVRSANDQIEPNLLKGEPSPYQNLLCLNRPELTWESQSHQTGFHLKNSPRSLAVRIDERETSYTLENGDVTPLILDQKAPLLQQFKTTLNEETKTLQINWQFEEPIQETTLTFQTENTCQEPVIEEHTLTHSSGLKEIIISLDDVPLTLDASKTTYQYSNLSYGTHTLTLKAYDHAGNVSTTQTETFELKDSTPVEVTPTPPIHSTSQSTTQNSTTNSATKPSSNGTASNSSSSGSNSSSTNSNNTPNSTHTPNSNTSNSSGSATESKPSTNPPASTPSYALPNDTKGAILTRISSRHSSISESDYHRILLGAYNITPTFVLQTIENKGFDIVLMGNNIRDLVRAETGWDAGWNYHGVTFPNYQGYVRIWSSLKGGSNILVHEIGHAYDYSTGQPSKSDEFQSLYESEASKLFPNGGLYASSADEYYAESFRMYLNERSTVKSRAPQTAAYFKGVFGF